MIVNGIKHGNRCACPVCDPKQARVEAARKAVEGLRQALAAGTRDNRCASAVVSVHFEDERCDHER